MQGGDAPLDDLLDDSPFIVIDAIWILPLREESIVLLEDHVQRVHGQPRVQTQGGHHILAMTHTQDGMIKHTQHTIDSSIVSAHT